MTRCSERAKDLMVKVLMEDYGNPSSLHTMGVVAERYIKEAKERIQAGKNILRTLTKINCHK